MVCLAMAVLMCACEKTSLNEDEKGKTVRIHLANDDTFTRALSANGSEMTGVWVFDFVDDEMVQYIHQSAGDADFGTPTMTLTYGEHSLCIVASRGVGPVLNTDAHKIVWERPNDTFWADRQLTVSRSSDTSVDVTLQRAVTASRLTVTDIVPEGLATLTVTPALWYYGLDYWLGEPCDPKEDNPFTVDVPQSYIGTQGTLTVNVYGFSTTAEWSTDVSLTASDADGNIMGEVNIPAVPFTRNKKSHYSGALFSSKPQFTLAIDDNWQDEHTGQW